MQRRRVASAVIAVCVAVLAGGWTYEDGMQAGSRNRASFQGSLPPKEALYARILVELDRITEVRATSDCGPPKGPAISCAGVYQPQGASLPTTSGYRGLLHLHPEHLTGIDEPVRRFLVRHELGHIVDFALVPEDLDAKFLALFRRSPAWKACFRPRAGSRDPCVPYMEIFADQFAYWASPPGQPDPSVTYGLPRLAAEADFQRILARSPLEDLRDESIFDRRRG
jgi:hypothetical protein